MNGNRHNDPNMVDESLNFDDSLISSVSNAIETCLSRREDIQPVLSKIRGKILKGEPAQSELTELLNAEPALVIASIAATKKDFEELLAAAEKKGELAEENVDEFIMFWGRNEWIEPGVEAYRRGNAHGSTFWTDAGIDCNRRNDRVYIQHQLEWGVDEVHDIEAPLDIVWNDLLARLQAILKKVDEEEIIYDEEIRFLTNSKQTIEDIYTILDEMSVNDEPEDEVRNSSKDDDDDNNGGNGSLKDTSLNHLLGTNQEDDRDESYIGFA